MNSINMIPIVAKKKNKKTDTPKIKKLIIFTKIWH